MAWPPSTRRHRAGEHLLSGRRLQSCGQMTQAEGWERLGELSRMLQAFRRMYVRREVDGDNPVLLNWRHELVIFLKVGQLNEVYHT